MPNQASGRISWPVALVLIALVAAALIGFVVYRMETWPSRAVHSSVTESERVARDIKQAFVDIAHLQPRVTVNNRIYREQTTPTSELTVISRRIEVEHEFENTWAGSSKRVKLHGTFNARAGFDLRQDFSIDIRPNEILVQFPHAQILGVEQEQLDVLEFENGLWNRISTSDVQSELSVLPALARAKAAEANLPVEAEQALRQQLEARMHLSQPVQIIFRNPERKPE